MTETQANKYWLDAVVADILQRYPEGELVVSSGVAPSASYHIGHFREVLTVDALAWGLRQAGRRVRHLHVVDNMDPLRKRYSFLPERFEAQVGRPICLVPDPFGCHDSYAAHFFSEFQTQASRMGVEMEVVLSYEDQYRTGKMAPMIERVLERSEKVRNILTEVAGRELPADWTPLQVMTEGDVLRNGSIKTWDKERQTIEGVSYTAGRVKLNWRLDWPARWALHGVQVEPFGRELATKGGSYDTGVRFARQVFEVEPPYPLPYDTINLVGETKKMSSSLGNLVTPKQALEIMPPEILRYFVLRSLPRRTIFFDPGLGLYHLIDEYSKIEEAVESGRKHEFEQAYRVASAVSAERVISSVPFSHLVAVYQAARGSFERLLEILQRTGYEQAAKEEWEVLRREAAYVQNWLDKYAPDSVKFAVQPAAPEADLTDKQKRFLALLAERIEASAATDGQQMHDLVYAAKEQADLPTGEAFKAIYRVILAKDSGPKAGWFLASLERQWLVRRLRLQS
ncbi:lysine--tRNA ligase [Candidatus Parcubacteria bacterium]|nr:lysine--tRNA ligase [Candidatus Parcubacteria bacterium]